MWNLPDDFNWREFDRHFGDDQPPEHDEADIDPNLNDDDEAMRAFWRDGFDERTQ